MVDATSFFSPKTHGFVRVAAATPISHVGDPRSNAQEHVALIRQAGEQGVDLMVFPELSLSAYAIDDLHMQAALLDEVERQIAVIAQATGDSDLVAVIGAPIRNGDALYNCAVVMGAGEVLGVVPKTYLPNYREYYEKRWFAPATARSEDVILLNGETVDFAPGLLFGAVNRPGFVFAVEICEDYWAPLPPSTRAALAGARILLNLSASNIVIGKADERAMLSASHSARTLSAYVFAASGWGESTTDLAWDGQATIHELGSKLAEGERFALENHLTIADVDVDRIGLDRLRNGTFAECARVEGEPATVVPFMAREDAVESELIRPLDRFPFVPDDAGRLDQDCYEAFNIQVQGLMRRMTATGAERLVIGVSGGLDSTQALLVACRAFDRLDLPRTNILAFTMPGFATSDGTRSNAWALMTALGVTGAEIDIRPAAEQMFRDIGHPYAEGQPVHDITFENVQAGLRTDYLFRLANQNKAFVLGTGDLSELALGWATYGVGDHMSHYNVNGGVAKTLIRHLIRWVATGDLIGGEARTTLHAILDTEISPELVPAKDGVIQSTEGTVGPYALNDFFLFYISRFGLKPSKVAFLAHQAWSDAGAGYWPANTPEDEKVEYDLATIKGWLRKFLIRFFQTAQFKRSALPNGPKVVTGGSLSPRGDWRAPSDGNARVWLDELDANVPD
ncbi:NAD(+) synthase [Brevundimonas intermedia]|uniref:Glutamine-dependent NAD(+) synthetase n=1 Tax=Brevundimonas intermedia TaxID=74315 RepID=A0A4Y9RT23_9CAUL|nr:NAD(+) synthase [Brevundimonas intermedia]TFW12043.1 NAD(+) synthase [Brevundimonas intermedia]